jgi:hypothetical protein
MLEVEIQKLTAAIETLTKVVQEMARPTLVVTNGTPTNVTNLEEAEKAYRELEKADRSYREDNAAREAMQAERLAKLDKIEKEQAEHAKTMDEVYGLTLAAKAKRKAARVTKEETEALIEAAKPVEKPVVTDQPLKDEPKEVVSDITAEDLKTMAMEIARADSSTRTIILEILGEHGAKTITQLDPKNYRAVHGRLMSLAHDIAKNGEEV